MRLLLALCVLLLAGCDDREEVLAWRGHPSIVLCPNQHCMLNHAPGVLFFEGQDGWRTILGIYERDSDTIYLLCSDPDQRLTIPQAFYLAHELQHRADAVNHGSMWGVLQDESSPNGHAMGGYDFDTHHHVLPGKAP